jgi:thiosulfate dehydrogenase [quinone] large subunit
MSAPESLRGWASVYLRLALGAVFLASVTDRFGLWGPHGTANVAWGDLQRFTEYTMKLNPWAPRAIVPAIVWIVTIAEIVLGLSLFLGFRIRLVAFVSGVLLLLFALGMTIGTGLKSALNASVVSASAGAFLLATAGCHARSLDPAFPRRHR